jgi:23S rRNA (uracil1939-C5)-methyltransferase
MARHRTRKKVLCSDPVQVTVESFCHDGRGVAHVDGKVVFIDEALAGEVVEFVYTDAHKDYAEGRAVNIIQPAPERVVPECPHYGVCGGCSFQHVANEQQIVLKQGLLQAQFRRLGKLEIPQFWSPLTGPFWGYRTKARMGVKYVEKKGRVLVGFRERRQPFLAEIDTCKVMHPWVGEKLPALAELIGQLSIKTQIPQIEVAIGDNECVLAIRVMQAASDDDKEKLRAFAQQHGLTICLQPKGVETIAPLDGEPDVLPRYALPDYGLTFQFRPAMFTQVNYAINRQMIQRVITEFALTKDDVVLDLFCGLGNFTLPLATQAGRVVGVEGDLPLIHHARKNALLNQLDNVEFYAADLSKTLDNQPWAQRTYTKVLLDPSRAGASEVLPQLKRWQPQKIIYVSCNPSTLARDAGILVHELGYRLVKAGVMDMFPQTAHVESMALFEK